MAEPGVCSCCSLPLRRVACHNIPASQCRTTRIASASALLAAGDLIYTNMPASVGGGCNAAVRDCQYFWEAFPSGSGASDRTTYLFSYLDADERRPSLEAMMEEYWRQMPAYQVESATFPSLLGA